MTSPGSLPKPKKPRLFALRRIVGNSMLPTLPPGKIVVVMPPRTLKPGDIVVITHNGLEKIKRIAALQHNQVFVRGDNAMASTDSRQFGWLDSSAIVAKVWR
jgi:nickel-type superoxide dismutase maturation protease